MPPPQPAVAPHVSPPRHPRPLIALHWISMWLLLAVFGLVLGREMLEDKPAREALLQLHRQLGMLAGSLTLLRLLGRACWPLASTETNESPWQRRAALAVQGLMYLLLLALPVLGWLLTNARGQPVTLPGVGALPLLLARDPDLADMLEEWHESAGWALAALVGLHAMAALWHHWVRRDRVLTAMWPGLRTRS